MPAEAPEYCCLGFEREVERKHFVKKLRCWIIDCGESFTTMMFYCPFCGLPTTPPQIDYLKEISDVCKGQPSKNNSVLP